MASAAQHRLIDQHPQVRGLTALAAPPQRRVARMVLTASVSGCYASRRRGR